MTRYTRTDAAASTVDAILLTVDSVPDVLLFLGTGEFVWEPASGILSVQTRQGAVLNIRAGSYVVRDASGHVTHIPAEAFTEAFTADDDGAAPEVPAAETAEDNGTEEDTGTLGEGM